MFFSDKERLARLKINSFSYLRADWLVRIMDIFGTGQNILEQDAQTLSEEGKITLETAKKFLAACNALDAEAEFEKTQKCGGRILFKDEETYPPALLDIKEPPLALYVRGVFDFENAVSVAMVGTRKVTPYGRRVTAKLADDLAQAGVTLVSGLARGVDSIAHSQAVKNKKPTWALVGTGIGRCYPSENRDLARAILDNGGAIISELPFDAPPLAQHFPRRNRLIAALSKLVVVIEGELKSGALITAKMALEQGLDVMSVPGPIDSPQSGGTNNLIRQGAAMALGAQDIIDALPLELKMKLCVREIENKEKSGAENLTELEQKVLSAIGDGSKTLDDVAFGLSLDVSQSAGVLFNLEVSGFVQCRDGKYFRSKF